MRYALVTALVPVDGRKMPDEAMNEFPKGTVFAADMLHERASITSLSATMYTHTQALKRKIERDGWPKMES